MKAPVLVWWKRLDAARRLSPEDARTFEARLMLGNIGRIYKIALVAGILEMLLAPLVLVVRAEARAGYYVGPVPSVTTVILQLVTAFTCFCCAAGLRPTGLGSTVPRQKISLLVTLPVITVLACLLGIRGPVPNANAYLIAIALVAANLYLRPAAAQLVFPAALAAAAAIRLSVPSGLLVPDLVNCTFMTTIAMCISVAAYNREAREFASSRVIERQKEELAAANHALQREHDRSEALLHNILPAPIAQRLKLDETIADLHYNATILFADIVDFTPLSQTLAPSELLNLLNTVFSAFDDIADRHGLEKIKTIGDAYMATAGLPEPRPDHAQAVALTALGMSEAIAEVGRAHGLELRLRIGIHSGGAVAGVIGKRKFIYDLWGDTVNTASRMESQSVPGKIQVSEDTYRLLAGEFLLTERGEVEIKGKGMMRTYFLEGRREDAPA